MKLRDTALWRAAVVTSAVFDGPDRAPDSKLCRREKESMEDSRPHRPGANLSRASETRSCVELLEDSPLVPGCRRRRSWGGICHIVSWTISRVDHLR